jgi:hypothetical protein
MHWLIFLLLAITAALIFYQDFSTRSVLWFLFPIIGILGLLNSYFQTNSWKNTFINSTVNAGFLLVQFFLLKLFYYLKRNNTSGLINNKIGLGDVFLLIACCFFFSPFNFLLFYCCSLLFALIIHSLVTKIFHENKFPLTIPLAGWMAVFLLIYVSGLQISKNSLTADDWILKYLLCV